MADEPTTTEPTIYVIYIKIKTTPDKLWAALTSAEFTTQYFFGRRVESDWKVGSTVTYWMPDGRADVSGKILECDPPRLVRFTWRVEWLDEMRALPDSFVTYKLEPLGDVVRLTMSEEHPQPIPVKYLEGGRTGWPMILSGLKSLMETGRALVLETPK